MAPRACVAAMIATARITGLRRLVHFLPSTEPPVFSPLTSASSGTSTQPAFTHSRSPENRRATAIRIALGR